MGHTCNNERNGIKNCLSTIEVYYSFLKKISQTVPGQKVAFVETEVQGPKRLSIPDSSSVLALRVFFYFFFFWHPFYLLFFWVFFSTNLFFTASLTFHESSLMAVHCSQSASSLPGYLGTKYGLDLQPPHRKAEPIKDNFNAKLLKRKRKERGQSLQELWNPAL